MPGDREITYRARPSSPGFAPDIRNHTFGNYMISFATLAMLLKS
jgi:hypothetical protein